MTRPHFTTYKNDLQNRNKLFNVDIVVEFISDFYNDLTIVFRLIVLNSIKLIQSSWLKLIQPPTKHNLTQLNPASSAWIH